MCQGERQRRPLFCSRCPLGPSPPCMRLTLWHGYRPAQLARSAQGSRPLQVCTLKGKRGALIEVISKIKRPCSIWGLLTARILGRLQCQKVPISLRAFSHTQLCCTPLGRIYLCIAFKSTSCARHRPESRQEHLLGIIVVSYHEGACTQTCPSNVHCSPLMSMYSQCWLAAHTGASTCHHAHPNDA